MKRKRKLLSLISALAIPLILSGCVNKKAEEKKLAKALEEEYGEEFIVVDSIVTGGHPIYGGPLEAICYPKSNQKLFFKATFAGDYIYEDEYVEAIVREEAYAEMEEILSQYYTDFFLDADVMQPMIDYGEREKYPRFTNISDVSIASYEEKYGEKMNMHFDVILSNEEISNYDEIKQIFEEYTQNYDTAMLVFQCCLAPCDVIQEFQRFEKNDIWENFYMDAEINAKGIKDKCTYVFSNGEFYLYELWTENSSQIFDINGNNILESEE